MTFKFACRVQFYASHPPTHTQRPSHTSILSTALTHGKKELLQLFRIDNKFKKKCANRDSNPGHMLIP